MSRRYVIDLKTFTYLSIDLVSYFYDFSEQRYHNLNMEWFLLSNENLSSDKINFISAINRYLTN